MIFLKSHEVFTGTSRFQFLFLFSHGLNEANTGCFIMFSVITNIYNKKTKGPTLMELFTATGEPKKFF